MLREYWSSHYLKGNRKGWFKRVIVGVAEHLLRVGYKFFQGVGNLIFWMEPEFFLSRSSAF
jgi:hypothetical protein